MWLVSVAIEEVCYQNNKAWNATQWFFSFFLWAEKDLDMMQCRVLELFIYSVCAYSLQLRFTMNVFSDRLSYLSGAVLMLSA